MSKIREQRLAEFYSQEGLDGQKGSGSSDQISECFLSVSGPRTSKLERSIEVTMDIVGDRAVTDSVTASNVRLGGITMRTPSPGLPEALQQDPDAAEEIIKQRMKKVSAQRTQRYQDVLSNLQDLASTQKVNNF
jgi:hypothetical protein